MTKTVSLLWALALAACATPIGVRDVGFEKVFETRTASVLDSDRLSDQSRQLLAAFGLESAYAANPGAVIDEIASKALVAGSRQVFALLAEMRYARALKEESAPEFLAAAIHAYFYLLDEELRPAPSPYDPWFRLMCDIYNRALAQALLDSDGNARIGASSIETSIGQVEITAAPPAFPWRESGFTRFLPADAYEVRGLRERIRTSGLGMPLIAVRDQAARQDTTATRHVGLGVNLPATALLEIHGGLAALRSRRIQGTLHLHAAGSAEKTTLTGREVPLEFDMTAPLAHSLEGSRLWDFSIAGFMSRAEHFEPGVYLAQPYQRGKIPLVFVHGTASNPATWAQMLNGLSLDPELRSSFQMWLAIYNTGGPILANAAEIRASLAKVVRDLDPEATDPAMDRMVVVGHSQGGLVSRLLVTSSGNRVWSLISDQPIEQYPIAEDQRERLRAALFFDPLPFIERVVFLSTPHRGSFVANSIFGSIARQLVTLPEHIVTFSRSLGRRNADGEEEGLPTSVDNMKEHSQFVQLIGEFPFAPDVHLHSIIAVQGDGPVESGDDGVVRYRSAQLPQAESELVVRSGHSCQNVPETIFELRRILLHHLRTPAPHQDRRNGRDGRGGAPTRP